MIKHGVLSALVGAFAYRGLLCLNRFVHWLHEVSGRPYWSLAQHVKTRIGQAQRYIATFRHASLQAAEAAGVDGIVCGHIHKAELVEHDNGLVYCNDGDWVESCTALVERADGALELLTWRPQRRRRSASAAAARRRVTASRPALLAFVRYRYCAIRRRADETTTRSAALRAEHHAAERRATRRARRQRPRRSDSEARG